MLFIIQLNSVIMYLLMAAVVASAAIKATGDDKDKFLCTSTPSRSRSSCSSMPRSPR